MKLECPYCWQHYEIAKSDINRELVCINCEQSFRVQDALIIDSHHRNGNYNKLLIGGLGLIIAILLIMNIWIWQRISSGFTKNLKNLGEDLVDFFVWVVTYSPQLILWAGIITVAVIVLRRNFKKRKVKKAPREDSQGE